ncbi:MAG: aldo/keto reductase [Abitibacteriaceae bacterium]|nr:aldo/keto reductase [Abditibacteriaceae bacterium]MBV9866162.1 aldo/keto reductase [Abditibacteriaceae bacterium]
MNLRPLGSTSLLVSPLGLGLAALGRPGYINLGHAADLGHATDLHGSYDLAAMEAHAHEVLDAAWNAGVRYFDAARSYGESERFLSSWLMARNVAPSSVTIGSKWGYTYTAGWQVQAPVHEVKDHSLAVLQRQWQESRALLGEHLDLYQIHSATLESGVLENQEVLAALAQLKSVGVLIGLTLSGPNQAATLRRAMEIACDGVRLFDCVQATWNLLETSATAVLREAHAAGMGVIIKEALANGRLTSRSTAPAFATQRARLEREAERMKITLDALALAAVLAQPWIDVVLSGAATTQQLLSNLAALEVQWNDAANTQLESLGEPPELYWKTRQQLAWN